MRASNRSVSLLISLALCAIPLSASACGEGMFNTGQGLAYQAYRAPRPAAVLVLAEASDADEAKQEKLYAGLKKAGHTVTVVRDAQSLREAMQGHVYQVVIAPLAGIDAVTATEGEQVPTLLPVIERALRNTPAVRNRFELFLLDGASLGQYLAAINKVVGGSKS